MRLTPSLRPVEQLQLYTAPLVAHLQANPPSGEEDTDGLVGSMFPECSGGKEWEGKVGGRGYEFAAVFSMKLAVLWNDLGRGRRCEGGGEDTAVSFRMQCASPDAMRHHNRLNRAPLSLHATTHGLISILTDRHMSWPRAAGVSVCFPTAG